MLNKFAREEYVKENDGWSRALNTAINELKEKPHWSYLQTVDNQVMFINKSPRAQEIFEIITNALVSLIAEVETKYMFQKLCNLIKSLQDYLTSEQNRRVQIAVWKMIQDKTWTADNYVDLLNNLPENYSKKILQRIIWSKEPMYFSGERANDWQKSNLIKHTDILKIIGYSIPTLTYDILKKLIDKCSPAAKSILRKIVWLNKGKAFIFDENMQPMTADYETLPLNDRSILYPQLQRLPGNIAPTWLRIFNEFRIIPVIPGYFEFAGQTKS